MTATDRPTYALLLWIVLVAALLFRIVAGLALNAPLLSDDAEYLALARSLSLDGTYALDGALTAYRPPGYPLFLAAFFTITDEPLLPVRILQAILDTFSCFLVYRLAARYTGPRWALTAAVIYAVFPLQILYTASVMSETVFSFLLLLSLVVVTEEAATRKTYFLSGLLAGAAVLVRPTGLIAPVVMLFSPALLMLHGTERMRRAGIFFAGILIVTGPWLIRNELQFGRLILTSHTGVNFWIGNHEGANGSFDYPEGNPLTHIEDEFERSDEGFRLGVAFLRSHPADAVFLMGKKIAYFFGVDYWVLMSHTRDPAWRHGTTMREIAQAFPPGSILLTHMPVILIVLLALYGCAALPAAERSRWMFIMIPFACWITAHLIFFGSARLRFPLHPFLIVAAVQGLFLLKNRRYPETRLRWATFGAIALLLSAGWIAEGWTIITD